MSNPVKFGSAPLPPANVAFTDPSSGLPSSQFYLSYSDIFNRTGGTTGTSIFSVQTTANNALILATTAANDASLALTAVSTAQSTADTANATANTANATANAARASINTINSTALFAAQNLSNVADRPTARSNLGVNGFPLTFSYDSLSSGLTRYVPLTTALTVPANFAGTMTWCGTYPTANAVFTLSYIRGSFTTTIGTVTLIHGGNYNTFSTFANVPLDVGDVLQLVAPNPADATLANVGITLYLELT